MPQLLSLPDNTTEGTARNPKRLQQSGTVAWQSILLDRLDILQNTLVTYINYLLTWDREGSPTPDFILDNIGQVLGQPRPADIDRETYRRILIVRRVARLASGTRPGVRRVVKALGDLGSGAAVVFQVPHVVSVTFANFAETSAKGLTVDIVSDLLLDAIGDVDRLQIWDAVGNAFSWDIEGQGWLQGVWATPLFDSKD